jgi:glycosyltransferase involved in cell wall biosynthesis
VHATCSFTVFTAAHNRAHTLHRVFDSLCEQTLKSFEWLVVDDGSTDGTEKLVAQYAKAASFSVRYFRQPHSGKHIAHNLAIREARGDFFLALDSDDACPPHALERMLYHWNTIPLCDRKKFSGVAGLCADQHGNIIGDRYPSVPFDATLRERKYVYRLRGEKWGSALTDIVRRFPFPLTKGTRFVPEGTVWLDMAKAYKDRCVNEVFRIYYINDDATGATLSRRRDIDENAPGWMAYYIWLLNNDLEYFFYAPATFLKAAVMLPAVTWSCGRRLRDLLQSLDKYPPKMIVLLALPASSAVYVASRTWNHIRR